MFIPFHWKFSRRNNCILDATCKSPSKEGETIILQMMVKLVDVAEKYKGVPYPGSICLEKDFAIAMSIAIIFKSKEEMQRFWDFLERNKP